MMQQEVSASEGSNPGMNAASLRELVIRSALEILDRDGLGLRPDSISYAKVFAYLEQKYSIRVTRGSVHERIWDTHDDFRREVLAEALDFYPADVHTCDVPSTDEAFRTFVGDHPDPERRIIEFSRRAGDRLWENTVGSPAFGQVQSLKAIASRFNDPIASEVLHEALATNAEARLDYQRQMVAAALPLLGRRLKRHLGLSPSEGHGLIHLLAATMSVGGHLNYRADCRDLGGTVKLRTGPAGEYESYSIASVAFRAVLDHLTEPVPDGEAGRRPTGSDLQLPATDRRPEPPDVPAAQSAGQRRTRDQLKRLVLAAGLELLLQDGLALKPESLRYAAVFAHIREQHGITVNRASVHGRLWSSHEDFCHDVLAHGVRLGSEDQLAPAFILGPRAESSSERESKSPPPDDPSRTRQDHDALDGLRLATQAWIDSLADSPRYRRRLLIKASLFERSEAAGTDRLRRAIQDTDRNSTDLIERFVRERLLAAGFIVRPELGLTVDEAVELTGTLAQAIITGVVFNRLSGIETVTRRYRIRRRDGSGRFDDCTAADIALRAYFEFLYCWSPAH